MTDHQIEKLWEALNEDGDLDESLKAEFAITCRQHGILVAVFNLGWSMGEREAA